MWLDKIKINVAKMEVIFRPNPNKKGLKKNKKEAS
jgi:hypothetical protein